VDFDEIERRATVDQFKRLGVLATVSVPDLLPVEDATVILDRDSTVRGNDGVFTEELCIIHLQLSEVPNPMRGTVVDTGKDDDRWRLLSKLAGDRTEERWTAGKHSGR
tara:strand:- start:1589 stop:1912 length:324 start_codon:yes stop_codon:yes gene_type:complete